MTKVITTTTIFPPSEALLKFAAMEGWQLVVAGDYKTPSTDYFGLSSVRPTVHFVGCKAQEQMDQKLSDVIGWNCIQRRNFAFLFACKELKADLVATIDDDNIPKDNWGNVVNVGKEIDCHEHQTNLPAFDPLSVTHHANLWHRGYPLELVRSRFEIQRGPEVTRKCDVQADLWDDEADVDAICRLVQDSSNCAFSTPLKPYTSNKPSPFNSQNTFLSREVMPHYFMFPGVGRMDDIWASYHVQAQGFRVCYNGPTVVQKRNQHSILDDLMNEMNGLHNNLKIVKEIPTNKNAVLDRLPSFSLEAFRLYQKHFE